MHPPGVFAGGRSVEVTLLCSLKVCCQGMLDPHRGPITPPAPTVPKVRPVMSLAGGVGALTPRMASLDAGTWGTGASRGTRATRGGGCWGYTSLFLRAHAHNIRNQMLMGQRSGNGRAGQRSAPWEGLARSYPSSPRPRRVIA